MIGKEKYTLVGIINIFDIRPEFVCPVFKQGNKYFIQDRMDDFTINCFEMLTDENFISRIKKLNEFSVICLDGKKEFAIGEDKLIGFELDKSNLFLGNYEQFKHYIGNINMSDDFMKIEVTHYIKTHDELTLKRSKTD